MSYFNINIKSLIKYYINKNNKFNYQGSFTSNATDRTVARQGYNIGSSNNYENGNFLSYSSTKLQTHQLSGEHFLPKSQIKVQWNGNYTQIDRVVPDMRGLTYLLSADTDSEDSTYTAEIPLGSPSFKYGGRFFSNLNDKAYGSRADVTVPFKLFKETQSIKTGVFYQNKKKKGKFCQIRSKASPTSKVHV